jgi:hypothetical protein
MSHKDIERAFYLRKVLEKQIDKADPELDYRERVEAAMKAMDEKVGPEWRKEIEIDGDEKLSAAEAEPFYFRVGFVGDSEGLGQKGAEAPLESERPKKESLKDQVMCRISKVLDKVL